MAGYWLMDRAGGEAFDLEQLIAQVEDVTEGMAAAAAMELQLDSVYCLSGATASDGEAEDEGA